MSRLGKLQPGSLAWFAGRGWEGTEEGQPLQPQERGPLMVQPIFLAFCLSLTLFN